MPNLPIVITFDVDPATLECLRLAFPGWRVEEVNGATTQSLARDWDPGAADLLVVGSRPEVAETLGVKVSTAEGRIYRGLRNLKELLEPVGDQPRQGE